ncbi:ATP-binding cassette domain-containing protein [Candidatus Woesearchaeota archaeon]|nr:ATP-binding cassette domain-containing protein [Candidatus Woesearchaeota archaeon]
MIEVKNLSYRLKKPILQNISFSIKEGISVALLGHNGSGKTTLVKHLNGLLKAQTGSVSVDDLSTDWEVKKNVGFLFQNPDEQLFSSIVEEDIAFGLENLGEKPAVMKAKVKKILNSLRIEQLAQQDVNELSFGQKQLVALAGVLVMEPKYLILDEPFSLLDPKNKSNLISILHSLKTTLILVTNNLDDLALVEEVILLKQGKIVFKGKRSRLSKQILKKADMIG